MSPEPHLQGSSELSLSIIHAVHRDAVEALRKYI